MSFEIEMLYIAGVVFASTQRQENAIFENGSQPRKYTVHSLRLTRQIILYPKNYHKGVA